MSKLIALVFDDPYNADEARAALFRMEGEGLLETDETAVVVKRAGDKVRITQDTNIVSKRQQVDISPAFSRLISPARCH